MSVSLRCLCCVPLFSQPLSEGPGGSRCSGTTGWVELNSMSLRNYFVPTQHMPINHLHLQSQEAPLERSLLLKMFLIIVLWVHRPLCCFQSPFCLWPHWRGCRLDFYSRRGRVRLPEEASGVYNHSQKVEELGSAHKLGDCPSLCSLDSTFPLLISLSEFALRFISIVSHPCSQTLLYWFHRPRWYIHTWCRHDYQPKEPSDSEIRESTLLQR